MPHGWHFQSESIHDDLLCPTVGVWSLRYFNWKATICEDLKARALRLYSCHGAEMQIFCFKAACVADSKKWRRFLCENIFGATLPPMARQLFGVQMTHNAKGTLVLIGFFYLTEENFANFFLSKLKSDSAWSHFLLILIFVF